ncbi:MAG: UvrD-helicase domain-containing protein, partial [Rhodospirillales bacterium]|nr:UvrD-helicase domain-containing protein [Rhodospirillales bacterium]
MSPAAQRREKTGKAAAAQRRAAEPETSVWVAASAGTGKTKVLTDRVLSLMLHGSEPARILCLTFTKAAAAEMANRLAARLAKWTALTDKSLAEELEGLLGRAPDESTLATARRLFARVLDAPGGIKIQTLHAFCQSLLGRFPLEAGVPAHFQVLDERSAAEMLTAAREEMLVAARLPEGGPLADAIAVVTAHIHEQGFTELMAELIKERARLARLIQDHGG